MKKGMLVLVLLVTGIQLFASDIGSQQENPLADNVFCKKEEQRFIKERIAITNEIFNRYGIAAETFQEERLGILVTKNEQNEIIAANGIVLAFDPKYTNLLEKKLLRLQRRHDCLVSCAEYTCMGAIACLAVCIGMHGKEKIG